MAVQAHGRNDSEYGGVSGSTRVVHNCDGRLVSERKEDERKDKDGARPCLRLFSCQCADLKLESLALDCQCDSEGL